MTKYQSCIRTGIFYIINLPVSMRREPCDQFVAGVLDKPSISEEPNANKTIRISTINSSANPIPSNSDMTCPPHFLAIKN